MKAPRRRFSRTLRYAMHRLFPRHGSSFEVALSVALGVWIAILPTLGVALVLTILATYLCRVPKGPALVSSFIATPPTLFFGFYPLAYFGVGLPVLRPAALQFDFLGEIEKLTLSNAGDVGARLWGDARGHVIAFLLGLTLVATATAGAAFAGTYAIMERKRRQRLERRSQRSAASA
jgi:uncharacterized protein (DUF2062 family)